MNNKQRAIAVLAELAQSNTEFADALFKHVCSIHMGSDDSALKLAADVARTARVEHGVETKKDYFGGFFALDLDFGYGARVSLIMARELACTARVVGQHEVEKPDYSAAPKIKVTEPIIEWECNPILEGEGEDKE